MKTKQQIPFIIIALMLFSISCDESSTGSEEPEPEIEIRTVEDLHAPYDRENPESTPFVYFNLRTGETVDTDQSDTENWDIAFRGTEVIVNSGNSGPGQAGALMLNMEFEQVHTAPSEGYKTDSEEGPAIEGNGGWYTYTGTQGNPAHAVIANDDVTIVLRTADGNHYAKLQIISYYKGNPDYDTEEFSNLQTRPPSAWFTFRYAIQQLEGARDLN